MKEIYDLRLFNEVARDFLEENEGKLADFVPFRSLKWNPNDGRRVKFMSANRKAIDSGFPGWCSSWSVERTYTKKEFLGARIFKMIVGTMFEPAGEECGTVYDELSSCSQCGSGAPQITPLFLRKSNIPKTKDIARTIAGEIVVSKKFADLIHDHQIKGAKLNRIIFGSSSLVPSEDWFQLMVENVGFEVVFPTISGNDPFDYDDAGAYKCEKCGLLGLNILSEVFVRMFAKDGTDFMCSRQFVGVRRGLLRPVRVICISKRLRELILSNGIKGVKFEVAYLR